MSYMDFSEQDRELAALMSEIADGNDSALSDFYDSTVHMVYGLTLRILGDVEEAEEVTGDVYLQVWEKASDYNPERGAPSTWLLTITRSRAIDRMRSTKKQRNLEKPLELSMATPDPNPEKTVHSAEKREIIRTALSRLSPERRKSIELAYFYGYTHREISEKLDRPLGTVKSWIRLGMMKLREIIILPEREKKE